MNAIKKTIKKLTTIFTALVMMLSIFLIPPFEASAETNRIIQNNSFWKDTSGNNIYSQGGGVFKFGDTYYWYGVHYSGAETYAASPTKKNNDTGFKAVTCYSSKDLVNWKFENNVLTANSEGFPWCYWFGRLGVAYNKNTKKYVLVAQHNDSVLFASCDSPTGNFKVENIQDYITNVAKQGTGDQTIFIDDDGKAYLICSNKGGRGNQYVAPLRESDYLAAEPATRVAKGHGREGNCMFKYKGKYYFCASDLHGWNSSHTYYMVADNIMGPYSEWKVMDGTDEDFSFVTQTGFFVTVHGSEQETVLYCGDRWSDFAGNGIGYNQWVPLSFDGDTPIFNSLSQWEFYAETGKWKVGAGNNYILNPGYDADRVSQEKLAGWTNTGTGNSNATGAHIGRFCMQQWSDSAFKGTMYQNVTLPNGVYTLKAWVKSSGGQKSSYVYINGYGGEEKRVDINKKIDSWTEITISDVNVTNGKCQVGISSDGNAGNWCKVDDFSLIGIASEPIPEPEPEPIPDGEYIKSLTVNDSTNYADWSIQQNLQQGDAVFGDRAFTFTQVPTALQGAERIRTACDSKKFTENEASFTAGADIVVYVGMDSRVGTPEWLSDWNKTDMVLTDDGDPIVTYEVYKQSFSAGTEVTLGAVAMNNAVNYVVMAKPDVGIIKGDVDADGSFGMIDAVMMQKYLLKLGTLTDPAAGDVCEDGCLNAFDLALMKKMLKHE